MSLCKRFSVTMGLFLILFLGLTQGTLMASGYVVTKLVSNVSGGANHTDPNLINPWGFFFTPNNNFWVADNNSSLSTLYTPNGTPVNFVIQVPRNPTGASRNPCKDSFLIGSPTSGQQLPASFLFATETGMILGYNNAVNSNSAVIAVDNSQMGAVYKGLEIVKNCCCGGCCGQLFLFAADFHNGRIDVFDSQFEYLNSIIVYSLPPGYAPFNVRKLDCFIYVTYAKQRSPDNHDDDPGPGRGFVDIFTENGIHVKRLISQGQLNSPWGLAIAPETFGQFAGALLVGNFGDGLINAYDRCTGDFLGSLRHPDETLIKLPGLWSLDFDCNGLLYFTSGPKNETGGLVGSISWVP